MHVPPHTHTNFALHTRLKHYLGGWLLISLWLIGKAGASFLK